MTFNQEMRLAYSIVIFINVSQNSHNDSRNINLQPYAQEQTGPSASLQDKTTCDTL